MERKSTAVPAACSAAAYCSPSSRSGSKPAVAISAGGSPDRFRPAAATPADPSARFRTAQVLRLEPIDVALSQHETVGEQGLRPGLCGEVGPRIDQPLQHRHGPSGPGGPVVARQLRYDCRQVAAGAVAADGDLAGDRPEIAGVFVGPPKRRIGVVDRGGCRVLRRQPVIDRQHVHVGVAAGQPAQRIVGVQVADHPAAAVVEDQQRRRLGGRRAVVPSWDLDRAGPGIDRSLTPTWTCGPANARVTSRAPVPGRPLGPRRPPSR